ncbi:hypothetical protein IGS67_01930 [Flavimobilis sp. GY10621]|uniref:GP-PDE domain-containing protein n=1 Tax=Flavimobilis rhizosphaerae TaxID=2775421 RepID=A0ABR9DM94_9MICO|nr:glycerophosphodiester phosphodiesterase family protein [Flavimobilis rhizosphaerae]MBD9698253.1 hypothetical protein [Flavimobilis rhizosphaerae]
MTQFIAHRGASATYPEHTRAAYVEALAQGADGLECDVQLTADGEVVLWHDAILDRTSDASGPLHALSLAELRALDVWSWRSTAAAPASHGAQDAQVLTLAEPVALAVGAGRPVTLVVELKHPSPAGHGLEDAVLAMFSAKPGVGQPSIFSLNASGAFDDKPANVLGFTAGGVK